jgi:hypothetical protein
MRFFGPVFFHQKNTPGAQIHTLNFWANLVSNLRRYSNLKVVPQGMRPHGTGKKVMLEHSVSMDYLGMI